nr:pentatricopeptide repeat-containing protein At5g02830, chloroplastic-like [Physcomitrium patens]|eukprot:XP_024360778.1 pentatricopeptide repeat-containing protein At5g02830, chloroplastic-like [Physcomitrella patens]
MKAAGVRPNAVTYNSLLRRHRNYGTLPEVQRALALYEEMREAGHVPNDFILQELIKEWVEGLSNPSSFVASGDAGLMKFSEAVLQKVAVDARREAEDNRHMTIDLHGLTKGEARAAVLVVLRAIKERYLHGIPVEDDLIIITGIGNHSETKGKSVLRDVVLGILQKELGLTVVSVLSDAPDRQVSGLQVARSSGDTSSAEDEELRKPLSETLEPRKPSRIINSGGLKLFIYFNYQNLK